MSNALQIPGDSGPAKDWRVDIQEQGRCGSVFYREAAGSLTFSWEFGGGDTVAILYFESEAAWRAQHPWTAGRRAEILRRVANEVVRQKSPGSRAEIDERAGCICLRQGTPPRLPSPAPTSHHAFRARLLKLKLILAAVVLLGIIAFLSLKSLFSIRSPSGVPVGFSVRTPEHIATLIQTLEPYVPSLHRNAGNDRFRAGLFLYPLDGRSPGKMIPLAKGLPAGDFQRAKLLGCDGHTVWFDLNGIGGVNLKTDKLIGSADLRRANPSLDEPWDDPRRISFDQRLRVTMPDHQRVFMVEPETLQAIPSLSGRDVTRRVFDPEVTDFLSPGVRPAPNEWLGLHSPKEAERDYRTGSRLSRFNHAESAKELRRFHRGQLGPEQPNGSREILSLTPLVDGEYFNAAFVRAGLRAEPLRFSTPEGFLMIYTSGPGLAGTLMAARLDPTGKIIWKVDTGIDRFKLSQILPDPRLVAFIGTRPPVPNKVPEPILVVVNTESGALSSTSLWK